jgi:hypothetical protein
MIGPSAIAAHRAAIERDEPGYLDPESGLYVLTEAYLRARGECCDSGCRHCPYGDGSSGSPVLSDLERYTFDITGALVVPGALSPSEVGQLNAALDANMDQRTELEDATAGSPSLAGSPRHQFWNTVEWRHPWCEPFRELIAHPRIRGYLDALLGRGWHLDHLPEVFESERGAQGHALHFGHHWDHPGVWYRTGDGRIRNGLVVVAFALTAQPAGGGGFCFVPGSHKSNFERSQDIEALRDAGLVRNPSIAAGDALIFTEAVTHGSLPWSNEHARRVVFHRYAAKTNQYGPGLHTAVFPAWVDELTPAQRAALEPARFYDRPIIGPDDTIRRVWDDYDPP